MREISTRRRDGLQNGAAIGFGGVALVTCLTAGSDDSSLQRGPGAVLLGGLGAGVGMLVDAAITRRVVVYRTVDQPVAAPDDTTGWDGGPRQSAPAPAAPQRPSRPWTLSVVTGVPSAGPLDDLERTMRDTGFDLDSGGCVFGLCFEPTSMPSSMHARAYRDSWTAGINRRIGTRPGVTVTGGRTLLGWTTGRHRGTGAGLVEVLPDGLATFPQTRVRVTHWFIGLGAGVRF